MIVTIIVFLIVLTGLVFVHELGHFVTARKFGAKVEEFGLGIPPRVVGVYRQNGKWKFVWGTKVKSEEVEETIYSLNLLPIGGFVKIKGEDGESRDEDSFASKKPYQKFIMLFAGVFMNFVAAVVLFSVVFAMGINIPYEFAGEGLGRIQYSFVQIDNVLKDSPADEAGIKAGDVVKKVNGREIRTAREFSVMVSSAEQVQIVLQRGEELKEFSVEPRYMEEVEGRKVVGVEISDMAFVKYDPLSAFVQGSITTVNITGKIAKALGEIIYELFTQGKPSQEVSGPVGIAVYTKKAMDTGIATLLQLAALLSLNLALINIIPFPALDGGRILFVLIEKIRGKPVSQKIEGIVHTLGFSILIILIVIITIKDVKVVSRLKSAVDTGSVSTQQQN